MRNIFKKERRPSSKKSAPRKLTKSSNLTDLQNLAKRHGIRFAGLNKSELVKELVNYGVVKKT
jgi:hypothetical protein